MGLLTIGKIGESELIELKVPNYVIQTLYWEYFDRYMEDTYEL